MTSTKTMPEIIINQESGITMDKSKDKPKDKLGKEINIADKKNVTNIEQTSRDLVGILFDEIEQLRDGKTDTNRAKAVSSLASQIIGTAKVEIEYRKLLKDE